MAAPIIPIEIWAYEDIILPNTHELNKSRPMDDLWKKGWDKGQKPTVEEFNYVLHMMSLWSKYITESQIPDLDQKFLQRTNNLSDVVNKATARTNLDVYSKAEATSKFVDITGDTMTGALNVPRINFPAPASDYAYITTTSSGDDQVNLDIVFGDNATSAGATSDYLRFRYVNGGNTGVTTLVEIGALTSSTGQMRVIGNIVATGTVNAPTITGTNMTASGTVTGGNLISNNSTRTQGLTVVNNAATVAGRHVVRAVNGKIADANGNVTVPLPAQGVQNMRLGSRYGKTIQRNVTVVADPGGVTVGWRFEGDNPGGDTIYFRAIQILINNQWVTIGEI